MATGGRQAPDDSAPEPSGATEPITLTDPDGAVTRVAPWSSWTREQVRAPGGEPALVTRLDQGQLWFSAGRKRSPWRHEVHVGPAIVSTPRGRFQAVAEPDGGATISCLAGRTRVVAGLREPVLLGPDQSAAVSSDGRTLVVMDRASGVAVDRHEATPLPEGSAPPPPPAPRPAPPVVPVPAPSLDDEPVVDLRDPAPDPAEPATAEPSGADTPATPVAVGGGTAAAATLVDAEVDAEPEEAREEPDEGSDVVELRPDRSRLGWLPEVAAVAALVALLVAAVLVFGRTDPEDTVEVTGPPTTEAEAIPEATTTEPEATTTEPEATTSTTAATTSTTATPTTSTVPPTSGPPRVTGAFGEGELETCTRAAGGVSSSVTVTHTQGAASRFKVTVGLAQGGTTYAQADVTSDLVDPGASALVELLVPFDGDLVGGCVVLDVTGIE